MKTTTTEIIIEREELIVINRRDRIVSLWCALCTAEVVMLSPDVAAVVAGIGAREIYRLVEANQVHFIENAKGLLLICSQSLREKKVMSTE